MCVPWLVITHQDAPTFFTSNYFIFGQACDALQFNSVNCEVTTFALVADKGGSTSTVV
jgi:hypothetical protein